MRLRASLIGCGAMSRAWLEAAAAIDGLEVVGLADLDLARARFGDPAAKGRAMKEQRFKSVWDAIEDSPAEAASMKARSDVMIAIREVIDDWKVTQTEAVKRLGVTQQRLNDLMRGRNRQIQP